MIDSNINDRNQLERLEYRQGQTLRARDLCDQEAIVAQLRWWHNRALHRAYGIGMVQRITDGLRVTMGPAGLVTVQPGLAYDAYGRELILAQARTVLIPPGPDQQTLFARFKPVAPAQATGNVSGACLPGGPPGVLAEMDLVWQTTAPIAPADGVPLAAWTGKQLSPDYARPLARPLARPHIASGNTIPNATQWQPWLSSILVRKKSLSLGVQVDIDTSSAGFTKTPCYFAWLNGPAIGPRDGNQVMQFCTHIESESAVGFRFRLLMTLVSIAERDAGRVTDDLVRLARSMQLSVNWLGIQPQPQECKG